mgnify:CR=1 FL=1
MHIQKQGSSSKRDVMLRKLHTVYWIFFPQTLIYIHIYTSLVKICTLHITVHTSHQLLAKKVEQVPEMDLQLFFL